MTLTVLPVTEDLGLAWCRGELGDRELFAEAFGPHPLPCPCFLMVMRADGGPGAIRALGRLFRSLREEPGFIPGGIGLRTRVQGVEKLCRRFYGHVTFDEGDGDRRWAWPPYPLFDHPLAGGSCR
jgi:hypothetical protein